MIAVRALERMVGRLTERAEAMADRVAVAVDEARDAEAIELEQERRLRLGARLDLACRRRGAWFPGEPL